MDIQQNIFQYFNNNPHLHILFVFNNMYVLDDLASMQWPDEYAFIEFDGKYFETKYRLEHELANKRVILCFPDLPSPQTGNARESFPLLDLLCANMEYMTDAAASYIQQHRIPSHFEPFVRKHIGLLPSSRFAIHFETLFASPDATIEIANRAMISGFLGENHILSWHEVFVDLILLEHDSGATKKGQFYRFLHNQQNADILKAFQTKWKNIFGFDYNPNSETRIEEMACSLKYNSITQLLTVAPIDSYKLFKVVNSVAISEINHIMELANGLQTNKKTIFFESFKKLSEKIREKNILQAYGLADYFYYTPELSIAIIHHLLEGLPTQFTQAIEKLNHLSSRYYFDETLLNLIGFALHLSYYYREKSILGKIKLNTPDEYVLKYVNKYCLLDTEYRQALQCFNNIPSDCSIADDCFKAKTNLDTDYAQITNQINIEWIRCLQESGQSLNQLVFPHQQEFFKGVINQSTKYVVIVSDAFRYEVARQLAEVLTERKHPCTLNFALAQLPTETKFCITTLLPHDDMQLVSAADNKLDIVINGKVRSSTSLRTELIQKFNSEAKCYSYNDLKKLEPKEIRAELKRPLSYIFHNVVDSLGHDGGPVSLPQACENAVEELYSFIKFLLDYANITNVILTADHGFIYNDIRFEDKDKFRVDEIAMEKTSRYYLTNSTGYVTGIAKFAFNSVHGANDDSNTIVAVPEGTNRLYIQGSNYQFAHGGASLQELIIPVLSIKHVDKDNREAVNVELLTKDIRIVSGHTRIEIYQADPVSALFHEIKIKVAIYNGDTPVTAIKELVLDKTSNDHAERITSIDLMLNTNNTPNIMQLRIYSDDDPINPIKTASVTNNTLIERDF